MREDRRERRWRHAPPVRDRRTLARRAGFRKDGSAVLCYTPHKTRLSSGRVVAWPVHPDIWSRLCDYRGVGRFRDKKYGAEMASSISGDDIRTVMRYYADPSVVHVENVRVVDLL